MNQKALDIKTREFESADLLYQALAEDILSILPKSKSNSVPFSFILSGGRSPVHLHKLMIEKVVENEINWSDIFFFFSDERCVKPDNELSNYAMAKRTLLAPLRIQQENVYRIKGELNPDDAAEDYHQRIKDFFKDEPRFDLAILGMGTDGHTASLFPQSPALEINDKFAAAAGPGPEGRMRVTLTYRALNAAKRIWIMVTGREKKLALDKALDKSSHVIDFPIKAIHPLQEMVFYVGP